MSGHSSMNPRGNPRRPSKRHRLAIVDDLLDHYPAIPTQCQRCGASWAVSAAGLCPLCTERQGTVAPIADGGEAGIAYPKVED